MAPREVRIPVGGEELHGLYFEGDGPCVVMAHGLAGTVDSGLMPFAKAIADAGFPVLAFDYRGFGLSGGLPRQTVSVQRQQDDYRAAIVHARTLSSQDKVVLWGVSLAGGHVLEVASGHPDVAAVVAMVPLVSGIAAGRHAAGRHPATQLASAAVRGAGSRAIEAVGRGPLMIPVVGQPGSKAAFSLPGAEESYLAIAGPSWRNQVAASVTMELGGYRPIRSCKGITAPTLVQIADLDESAPPQATAKAAFKARAEVRHYPCDHFDVFAGRWHEAAVAHQISFLRRHVPR